MAQRAALEAKYRDAAAAAEAAMAQAEEYRQMLQSAGAEQNRAQVCGVFALVYRVSGVQWQLPLEFCHNKCQCGPSILGYNPVLASPSSHSC